MITQLRTLLAVFLICFATPALAAERVLITHSGTTAASGKAAPEAFGTLVKTAKEKGTVKVIVGLRVPFAAEGKLGAAEARVQRADIARATSSFRARFADAIKRKPASFRAFGTIPFAAVEVSAAELDRLAADPEVISITENGTYRTQLDLSIPQVRADEAWNAGFPGTGQTVAIIDTGVEKTHPFLANKVVAEACFSFGGWCPGGKTSATGPGSGMPCPGLGCDHGTHVAGIAAGLGSSFSGVARQSNIIAIQVFSDSGFPGMPTTSWSDLIAGLEHVDSLRGSFAIASVNMSLGGGLFDDDCDATNPALQAAMANLRSQGVAPVVASGNFSSSNTISSPACLSSAVSVGAVASKDSGFCQGLPANGPTARDRVVCFSNSSPKLSLLAPGYQINSSVPDGKFARYSGTSMAAPHVAGAWAVMKQKKPTASVQEVLELLDISGTPVADYRTGRVKSRIDVKAALDAVDETLVRLSYTRTGSGKGTVNFSPAGTRESCSSSCSIGYVPGTVVTLTARPIEGGKFSGWSGACSGTEPCSVTMSEARSVTASFDYDKVPLSYEQAGQGKGQVSFFDGVTRKSCDASCMHSFDPGTEIFAFANPAKGSSFAGWSGACDSSNYCAMEMSEARSLKATFDRKAAGRELPLTLTMSGTGSGEAWFLPTGSFSFCKGNCVNNYAPGTRVIIYPFSKNSTFGGWGGTCSGSEFYCELTISRAQTVTLKFDAGPRGTVLDYTKSGTGSGSINFTPTGEQSTCSDSCENAYPPGTKVELRPVASANSEFKGWSGACRGSRRCIISMKRDSSVAAIFNLKPVYTLSYRAAGSGTGTVRFTASPENAECTGTCARTYVAGTRVTLSATAAPGSVFRGWSGACRGTRTCTVLMRKAQTVTATFGASNNSASAVPLQ